MSVLIETSFGDITIDLFQKKAALNFIKLCKLKYYNNAIFIEVQKNFVTRVFQSNPTTIWRQLGDKSTQYFEDEINVESSISEIGLIGTANKGPHLNNSDFFITLSKNELSSLNGKHTIFGKVAEGIDVLRKINGTYVDQTNRPQMNIRILHTFVLEDPYSQLPNMPDPPLSPPPQTDAVRLEAVQHIEMLEKCKTEEEMEAATRRQKSKKQALTLQILGDLPQASIKPPENILFVCKLNPITKQKDLEAIFSRFGSVKSVEVVRDWKTGQSLQYAFIEFENVQSCEEAYLKMDNVLIDDRRIKVDFSQSVSKLMPKTKQTFSIKPNRPEYKTEHLKEPVQKINKDGKLYYGNEKYQILIKNEKKMIPLQNQDNPREKKQDKQHKKQKRESQEDLRTEKRKKQKKKKKHYKRSRFSNSYSSSSSHKNASKRKKIRKIHKHSSSS